MPIGARVDLECIALVDEEGDGDDGSGLECRWLDGTGCGVTLHAGFGVLHLDLDEVREFDADGALFGDENEGLLVFLQQVGCFADQRALDADLLESL